jgi:hypothetical protein
VPTARAAYDAPLPEADEDLWSKEHLGLVSAQ